jgi:PhnB protein
MSKAKNYIPEGHRAVTAHLSVSNGLAAIAFYEKAFGAKLVSRSPGPNPETTMHAEIRIADSAVFLMDMPGPGTVRPPTSAGGTSVVLHLFVPDADAVYNRALAAGGTSVMPPMDMFWGDRYGQVADPFGHVWAVATHKEDLSEAELESRAKAFYAQMAAQR